MSSTGGTIYAIGVDGASSVKIGKTTIAVTKRLAALQTAHPLPLTILASVAVEEGLSRIEKALHRFLEAERQHGEWFAIAIDQEQLENLILRAVAWLAQKSASPGTPINPRIGERIQRGRRRQGWTQKEFADKAAVSFAVISRLETGQQSVSAERLAVMARLLGLSLDEVCREEDDARGTHGVRGRAARCPRAGQK